MPLNNPSERELPRENAEHSTAYPATLRQNAGGLQEQIRHNRSQTLIPPSNVSNLTRWTYSFRLMIPYNPRGIMTQFIETRTTGYCRISCVSENYIQFFLDPLYLFRTVTSVTLATSAISFCAVGSCGLYGRLCGRWRIHHASLLAGEMMLLHLNPYLIPEGKARGTLCVWYSLCAHTETTDDDGSKSSRHSYPKAVVCDPIQYQGQTIFDRGFRSDVMNDKART